MLRSTMCASLAGGPGELAHQLSQPHVALTSTHQRHTVDVAEPMERWCELGHTSTVSSCWVGRARQLQLGVCKAL